MQSIPKQRIVVAAIAALVAAVLSMPATGQTRGGPDRSVLPIPRAAKRPSYSEMRARPRRRHASR